MRKFSYETFEKILVVFVCVLAVAGLGLAFVYHDFRMDDSQTVMAECEVVDKYREYHLGSRYSHGYYSYHIVLGFSNEQNDFEETIQISEDSFYQEVQIGDMIPCSVIYDGSGIIKIDVDNPSIDQYNNISMVFVSIGIFAICAVLIWSTFF